MARFAVLGTTSSSLMVLALVLCATTLVGVSANRHHALHLAKSGPLKQDFTCVGCVIVLTMVENGIKNGEQPILDDLCKLIPDQKWRKLCDDTVAIFGPLIIDLLEKGYTPDDICEKIKLCSTTCPLGGTSRLEAEALNYVLKKHKLGDAPAVVPDEDGDLFSPTHTGLRAADWRGMDCDDSDTQVHPSAPDTSGTKDQNCNGISGSVNGTTYEDMFCAGEFRARTVCMMGDSASSGFHIPPEWLSLQDLSIVPQTLNDEFDHPQLSWSTGFEDSIKGESILLQMLARSKCNHRQYQNVGWNGAEAKHMVPQVHLLRMDKQNSPPAMVFAAFIGNDVCKDTLDKMTTVEQFKANIWAGLNELEKILPAGSHFMGMGLVRGGFLYETMHNQIHPLGVTYAKVYEWLECTGANPCLTWLTANETTRNATDQRAYELSEAYKSVVAEAKASGNYSFDLTYMDFPLEQAVQIATERGIPLPKLIEPMDGFHPSVAIGHRLFSEVIGKQLDTIGWLGKPNPSNAAIEKQFGDQGGW